MKCDYCKTVKHDVFITVTEHNNDGDEYTEKLVHQYCSLVCMKDDMLTKYGDQVAKLPKHADAKILSDDGIADLDDDDAGYDDEDEDDSISDTIQDSSIGVVDESEDDMPDDPFEDIVLEVNEGSNIEDNDNVGNRGNEEDQTKITDAELDFYTKQPESGNNAGGGGLRL